MPRKRKKVKVEEEKDDNVEKVFDRPTRKFYGRMWSFDREKTTKREYPSLFQQLKNASDVMFGKYGDAFSRIELYMPNGNPLSDEEMEELGIEVAHIPLKAFETTAIFVFKDK